VKNGFGCNRTDLVSITTHSIHSTESIPNRFIKHGNGRERTAVRLYAVGPHLNFSSHKSFSPFRPLRFDPSPRGRAATPPPVPRDPQRVAKLSGLLSGKAASRAPSSGVTTPVYPGYKGNEYKVSQRRGHADEARLIANFYKNDHHTSAPGSNM
jgi:hypothetical protein